jgi:hypothetical protein
MPKSGEFCTGHRGTGLLIRALAPYKEDQMAQPAWKRPGSAKDEPEVQAPLAPAVERQGS